MKILALFLLFLLSEALSSNKSYPHLYNNIFQQADFNETHDVGDWECDDDICIMDIDDFE